MTTSFTIMAAVAIILSTTFCSVTAQGPSPAPMMGMEPAAPGPMFPYGPSAGGPATDECFNKLLNMSDCLTYVEENSNTTAPDPKCCPELAGLVDSNPICLCDLLSKPDSFFVKIDVNRALELPSVCGVNTPPPSTCAALGYPLPGPISSVGATPPDVHPPTGVAASPSSGKIDNGASSIAGCTRAFFVSLALIFLLPFF